MYLVQRYDREKEEMLEKFIYDCTGFLLIFIAFLFIITLIIYIDI